MKLSYEQRQIIAKEIFEYNSQNSQKPTMHYRGKNWLAGATLQSPKTEINNISIAELLELSDAELLELQSKVQTAKKAKEVKTRQERYFLK